MTGRLPVVDSADIPSMSAILYPTLSSLHRPGWYWDGSGKSHVHSGISAHQRASRLEEATATIAPGGVESYLLRVLNMRVKGDLSIITTRLLTSSSRWNSLRMNVVPLWIDVFPRRHALSEHVILPAAVILLVAMH